MKLLFSFLCTVMVVFSLSSAELSGNSFRAGEDLSASAGSLHLLDPGPVVDLSASSAVLLDFQTGQVLFEKNPDLVIPPASMTKLVVLHVLLGEVKAGNLKMGQELIVPEAADFRNAPPRSSLMFLQEGQRLTLLDLMRGLALPSGNDGAELAALLLGGTRADYVARMNREMERLGFHSIHFVDSSGYSEENRATAGEFARFCRFYIQEHPEATELLHSLESFSYPEDKHLYGPGQALYGTITQPNHNSLAGRHPWVDGLKTGYIDESGYNVALSAQAGGRRLVAVLMGGPGENSNDGNMHRIIDGTNLLAYGFYRFTNVTPPPVPELLIPVIGASQESLSLSLSLSLPSQDDVVLLREEESSIHWEVELPPALRAPVEAGELIGTARLLTEKRILRTIPLRAPHTFEKEGFFQRILRSLRRLSS